METRRIVITGIGMVTALGCNKAAFWPPICEGKSGVSTISGFDSTVFDVHIAGEVKDFVPEKWIERKQARRLDRFAHDGAVRESSPPRPSSAHPRSAFHRTFRDTPTPSRRWRHTW